MRTVVLAAAIVGLATAADGQPAQPRPSALTFPSSPLTFPPASALSFSPPSAFAFSSSPISFPSGPVQLETTSTVEIDLPADVLFDFDKAEIRPDAAGALHEVAQIIREKARGAVAVNGHTDGLGAAAYNQKLSERRAASVKAWLSGRENLKATAFNAAGFGARQPVAPNAKPDGSDDPEGRQRNRRVSLIIRK